MVKDFSLKIKSASSNICAKSSNSGWMKMAKIGLPKGSGKWLKVREKSVKSQGILKWILSGNPDLIELDPHATLLLFLMPVLANSLFFILLVFY